MKKIVLLSLLGIMFAMPVSATTTIENPLVGIDSLEELMNRIVNFVFIIALSVVPALYVIGGFMMVTSAGDATKFGKGMKMLLYTSIGLVIILLSRGIVALLQNIMGA